MPDLMKNGLHKRAVLSYLESTGMKGFLMYKSSSRRVRLLNIEERLKEGVHGNQKLSTWAVSDLTHPLSNCT